MGENRKKVDAILRKVAKKAERANKQAVACPNCKTRIEARWQYCAQCGADIRSGPPSTTDRPFGCPPDEEAGQ